jgi:hypothetical protein
VNPDRKCFLIAMLQCLARKPFVKILDTYFEASSDAFYEMFLDVLKRLLNTEPSDVDQALNIEASCK